MREETSTALLSLQNPRSETDVLTCPLLWSKKARTQSLSFTEASVHIGHYKRLRRLADEVRPKRFIAYCSWKGRKYYELAVQVSMLQAAEGRKFYLWPSLDPNGTQWHPNIEHLVDNYKMHNRQAIV